MRKYILMLIDSLTIICVFLVGYFVSTMKIFSVDILLPLQLLEQLVYLLVCMMFFRIVFRMYSKVWRYANTRTYLELISCDVLGGFTYIIVGRFFASLNLGVSYSLLNIMAIMILTLASRFFYQQYHAISNRHADSLRLKLDEKQGLHKINIAIVGAGNVGVSLAESLERNPLSHYHPICFIDKDISKIGKSVNGLKVLPEDEKIVKTIQDMPVQEIIIALPDLSSEDKAALYDLYKQTGCKVKLYDYPTEEERTEGAQRTLREFKIEDVLFRDSIKMDNTLCKSFYYQKTVMVTGGGGSIGSELCRQIATMKPKKLVIVDIYENNAYEIQQELIRKYGDALDLDVLIASVRDVVRMEDIFKEIHPDVVFHAAAHKHVPLMERSGVEALKNNVFGTYNVANLAEKYGVQKFLLISTDKAVNPTNIMGATKRLCEMVVQCRHDSKTEFTAVRFGNVLGSNGSVIPLFKKQIAAGGPITLTDKRIIRYFMTIPEAVQLVMQTCAMAHNGELFVLDMGKPVKILELAENMIRLSGLKPYEDIDIVEVGLRPGEKLYEELLMKSEDLDKTANDLIFVERDKGIPRDEMEGKLALIREAIQIGDNAAVKAVIKKTVPTFHEPEEVNKNAAEAAEMKVVEAAATEEN